MSKKKAIKEILKQFWNGVVKESDVQWITKELDRKPNFGPCGDLPAILNEMVNKGVDKRQIARFARIMQYQTLFQICCVLNGNLESDNPSVSWGLVEVEPKTGRILSELSDLDEQVLQADPEDNEMRPSNDNDEDYSVRII